MSGFGYRVTDGRAERVAPAAALDEPAADFTWVHLASNEEARGWLTEHGALDDYAVDALTATETRPRCEALRDAALVNMRGRTAEELAGSDVLASLRLWASKGQVFTVTPVQLIALDQVRGQVERGDP